MHKRRGGERNVLIPAKWKGWGCQRNEIIRGGERGIRFFLAKL